MTDDLRPAADIVVLKDWPAIQEACLNISCDIVGTLVARTPSGYMHVFRMPLADYREELREIGWQALLKYLDSVLKPAALAGKLSFEDSTPLRAYVTDGLLTGPRGQYFKGSYLRLLESRAAERRAQDSVDALMEQHGGSLIGERQAWKHGGEALAAARLTDEDLRERVESEITSWADFMRTLTTRNAIVAREALFYVLEQLRETCDADDVRGAREVLARCQPSLLGPLSSGAVKRRVQARDPTLSSSAFDSRAHNVREQWKRWLAADGFDFRLRPLMQGVLGRKTSRRRSPHAGQESCATDETGQE